MIEQKLEKKIIDSLTAALTVAGIDDINVIGAWQIAAEGDVKGGETASSRGYLTVKVSPRQHETFTIAEASFVVSVALNIRVETDARGLGYLAVTDACSAVLYSWQKSFTSFANALSISTEFAPSGFRLDGGDCGLDQSNSTWSWLQNFTVQGVILT